MPNGQRRGPVRVRVDLGAGGLFVGGLAGGACAAGLGGVVAALAWRGGSAVWVALCLRWRLCGVALVLVVSASLSSWSAWRVVSLPFLRCLLLRGLLRLAFVLGVFLGVFWGSWFLSDFVFFGFVEFGNSFAL